jgi:hypothetical protein
MAMWTWVSKWVELYYSYHEAMKEYTFFELLGGYCTCPVAHLLPTLSAFFLSSASFWFCLATKDAFICRPLAAYHPAMPAYSQFSPLPRF